MCVEGPGITIHICKSMNIYNDTDGYIISIQQDQKLFTNICIHTPNKALCICTHSPAFFSKVLGADALRMRLRRLTETKSTGKTWVDEKTQADYKAGGERREWLEIALLEALKKHGTGRDAYKRVKVCTWGSAKNCIGFSRLFIHLYIYKYSYILKDSPFNGSILHRMRQD